jgi:hypothetical protein
VLYSNENYRKVLAAEAAGHAAAIATRRPIAERVAELLNELSCGGRSTGPTEDEVRLHFPDEQERLTPECLAQARAIAGRAARGRH